MDLIKWEQDGTPTAIFTMNSTTDVVLADVDGDGDLDLHIAYQDSGAMNLWLKDGQGNFQLEFVFANVAFQRALGAGNRIWLNDGSAGFAELALDAGPASVTNSRAGALGDLDGDGDLDLFLATNTGSRVWLGQDAPGIIVPGDQTTVEETWIAIAGLSVADADSSSLSITISVAPAAGLLMVDGVTASSITRTGAPAALNARISNIRFQPAGQVTGIVPIQVSVMDSGSTTTATITVNVVEGNDAPTLTVPAGLSTLEDTPVAIKTTQGIVVTDVETDDLTITLSTSNGTLTLDSVSGSAITLTGTADELATRLEALVFTPRDELRQDRRHSGGARRWPAHTDEHHLDRCDTGE